VIENPIPTVVFQCGKETLKQIQELPINITNKAVSNKTHLLFSRQTVGTGASFFRFASNGGRAV
jgi:hypothetical protein